MSLLIESEIRNRAQREIEKFKSKPTAESLIIKFSNSYDSTKSYDIFLSHSSKDAELILGIKSIIEDFQYSVYVDWIDDAKLDRSNVTKNTAQLLRERMNSSKTLFYVTTNNANNSIWMPWECGYFDGIKGKVAILPVEKKLKTKEYKGQEYLGLYPYITKGKDIEKKERLWVRVSKEKYFEYEYWRKTENSKLDWKVR